MTGIEIKRLDLSLRDDFYRVHCEANDAHWCFCSAWWVDSWKGWGGRTAEQNLAVREQLFESGVFDGYLIYIGDEPVGWVQAGPRDQYAKLAKQFNLSPDPDTWAITCLLISPQHRRQGLAKAALTGVIDDLRTRNVKRLEAFPRRGQSLVECDLWTGPERLFLDAGFVVIRDDPVRPVLALDLK